MKIRMQESDDPTRQPETYHLTLSREEYIALMGIAYMADSVAGVAATGFVTAEDRVKTETDYASGHSDLYRRYVSDGPGGNDAIPVYRAFLKRLWAHGKSRLDRVNDDPMPSFRNLLRAQRMSEHQHIINRRERVEARRREAFDRLPFPITGRLSSYEPNLQPLRVSNVPEPVLAMLRAALFGGR